MQTIKSLALMVGAGVLVGGGGMLAMRHVAGQMVAPPGASSAAPAAGSDGESETTVTTMPPAPETLPDGMPAGPVITPDALQTPPTLAGGIGPRPDGSVDADGTPGFVPTQPAGATPDGMNPPMTMSRPVAPASRPDTGASTPGQAGLDPKGFDPVPSR